MGKQSSISVVIPNYCGQSLLEKYLPYLLSALNSSKQVSSYEVIIVDDASLDNSVTFLETFYPNILLLQNEKNVGFSQTINKGIFAATKNFIFVLNNEGLLFGNPQRRSHCKRRQCECKERKPADDHEVRSR